MTHSTTCRMQSRPLVFYFLHEGGNLVEEYGRLVHLYFSLLIVSKEDFDWHPRVLYDFETRLDAVKSLYFILGQLPAIELVIAFDPLWCDAFRDDTCPSL